jgi:ketosteroid isomerase-like protein
VKGKIMSIIAAYNEAWENGNVEALAELIHDDCVFNPHVGGFTMSKADILGFAGGDNTPQSEQNRILFENDEVGVAHSIVHFANDSDSEAVMSFMRFKDGKIILMETGATPLSDSYKLIGSE